MTPMAAECCQNLAGKPQRHKTLNIMYSQYCTIQNDQKDTVTAWTWDYIYTAKISVPIIVVL